MLALLYCIYLLPPSQNKTMDRKIWAFSQKMSWLFWLFWLFLYLSLGKMAFSSWLFWLFAQKARLFWLFAKLGYIVVAFVDVYKLIYHFFHYKVLFTSIFWLFPGFCKKTVCSARLLYLAVRKWQNGNLERKIWAFSQKMRWLFWLFWLFLYLSLCKMAFSSLAFCQKSHVRLTLSTQWLFWLLPGFFLEEKAREKAVPIHTPRPPRRPFRVIVLLCYCHDLDSVARDLSWV